MIREPVGTKRVRRAAEPRRMTKDKGRDTNNDQTGDGSDAGIGTLPQPYVRPRREQRVSWIWLVPILAVIVGSVLMARDWLETGPSITISFKSAEGIEVGQTRIRFKDVAVGVVSDVSVDHEQGRVLVTAELNREGAEYITQPGSRFWVVRPRLAISGVSGLGTILSGVYIAVDTPGASAVVEKPVYEFEGLEQPPEVTSGRPGTRYTLESEDLGWLDIGSPVYYRRIQVGQVIGYSLDEDGNGVNIQIFIDAPHDRFVTRDARFWNASGVNFSLDAEGLSMQTGSLAAILGGGVAFAPADQFDTEAAAADAAFELHSSQVHAMADPDGDPMVVEFHFYRSVCGRKVGVPVDFRGLEFGRVTDIDVEFDKERRQFFALVQAEVYPKRFGALFERIMELDKDPHIARARFFENMVARGLRAQMRAANLLTGQQYVALEFFRNEPPVAFDGTEYPPVMPTITGDFDRLQQQLGNIVAKVEELPLDGLVQDLRDTLQAVTSALSSVDGTVTPEITATLKSLRKTLTAVDRFVAEGTSSAGGLEATMRE